MNTSPFRWGILGPGRIAHRFAQALEDVDGARLQAVASRSAERAQDFAQKYGAHAAYDSDEALAADPAVDAIYIAYAPPIPLQPNAVVPGGRQTGPV